MKSRIQQEIEFAESVYARYEHQLDINPKMLAKYATPHQDWDWRQMAAKLLGPVAGADLLDFGCGMGEESMYFAKLGARVTAFDVAPKAIQILKNRSIHNGLPVNAFVADALSNGLRSHSFDVIHGLGIIHHLGADPGFAEIDRLLRPGGRAVFLEHMGNSALIECTKGWLGKVDYTDYEKPLTWAECLAQRSRFQTLKLVPYHILSRLRKSDALRRIDHAVLRTVPALRYFASGVVIYIKK